MPTYPNDTDGEALRRIAEDGNDMSGPMDVDFHVAAPDESVARRVAEGAAGLGYRTSIFFDDEEADLEEDDAPWTCECTKSMVPGYDAILAAQAELDAVAKPLGAYCDGWGTFGNAPAARRPWWKFW
jgi:regulator of RNase E activity RraB